MAMITFIKGYPEVDTERWNWRTTNSLIWIQKLDRLEKNDILLYPCQLASPFYLLVFD
uniref:Uncharacterized protein n=1 Tax=Arundo donax TaxID=35708 RepID=A0A0A9ATG0_ARUDO